MVPVVLLLVVLPSAAGHGNVVVPPQWGYGNQWYENYTFIPGDPTISTYSPLKTMKECPKFTIPSMRDSAGNSLGCYGSPGLAPGKGVDSTFNHPWRAPGTAFATSPCGVYGGNPKGCPHGNPSKGNCNSGGSGHGPDGRAGATAAPIAATWQPGSVQTVTWKYVANHNGGYSYRMCKIPENPMDMTEECFTKTPLNFYGNTSTIRYTYGAGAIEIPAMDTTEGTHPPGSMWRRNPIPCCTWLCAGPNTGCKFPCAPQFDPPINVKTGKSTGISGYGPFNDWVLEDKIVVPDLPDGVYALGWRWDTEEFMQVWTSCSKIKISGSPAPPHPPAPTPAPPSPSPPCVDKDVGCHALSCGLCGSNIGGCISEHCDPSVYTHEKTNCTDGGTKALPHTCNYHCRCKSAAAPAPLPNDGVSCVDKDHVCPTSSCGGCGKDMKDADGCMLSGCPADIYDHESTGCEGGQCQYRCKCKKKWITKKKPEPYPCDKAHELPASYVV